jgi:prophage protein DUF1660
VVVLDPSSNDHQMMGKLLCRLGLHRWGSKRNPESGVRYLECARCRKQKDTITMGDTGGMS